MEVVVLGRRLLAIVASMALLGSSLLPPAHRHVASSLAAHQVAAPVHQHLTPHHAADHDRTSLHDEDDDDDHVVQLVELPSLGAGASRHRPQLDIITFESSLVSSDETRVSVSLETATASPPEPPIPSHSLRAPPA